MEDTFLISFFFFAFGEREKNGHTKKDIIIIIIIAHIEYHHVDVLDDFVPIDRSGGQGHRAPRERRWRRRRKRSVVLRPSRDDDDDGPAAGRQSGSGVRRRWRASSRETHGRESVVRDARSGCFFLLLFLFDV